MKHYKIISFGKIIGTQRHLYVINRVGGQETGSYICDTLNDVKIESDFCCEENSYIDSIKDIQRNLTFEKNQVVVEGLIEQLKLKNGRGVAKIGNNWINIAVLHHVPITQPIVAQPQTQQANNDMGTIKKTATKVVSRAAPSPSRSQIKKEELFKEIEDRILAVKDIRLAKFFKRDLPKTVKEFLINFFTTYNNDHATIYVDGKDVQTTTGRRRSLGDIYKICKYYYPNVTLTEVVKLLFKDLQIHFKTGFRHSYCGVINKRVFYYSPQETNFEQDTRADEYGKNLEYYKSKV